MGADGKSILRKCGDILINCKTINKKTKIYTFNCAFCDANCDQLKKFSIHLEDNHLQEFHEEPDEKPAILEPQIKVEEIVKIDKNNHLKIDLPSSKDKDPLETCEISPIDAKRVDILDEGAGKEELYSDMDYQDLFNDNDHDDSHGESNHVEVDNEENQQKIQHLEIYNIGSDICSDDSKDTDFELDKNLNNSKRKKHKKKLTNKEKANGKEIYLLQAFEKHPNLWMVKERTSDNDIIQKGFETIAQEVNAKLRSCITWKAARRRINEMRVEYSNELENQRNGKDFEMPWYSEHMKFLQENIDFLLKCRYEKSKYRRLEKMDEKQLSILIEIYKKYEHLWNVNNIAFGLKTKRDEAFNQIIEELRLVHKLEITVENLHRRINYMKRMYSKDKQHQLNCELEKCEFIPSSRFFEQMSFLQECQGPFKCSECNEIIERYDNYHMHIAAHNNTLPFRCSLCEKGYKRFEQLLVHAKGHLGLYNHDCSICGKSYHSKAEIDYHMTSHTGDKPYLCQICGASFRAVHGYDHHIRSHEKRYRYECHICKHGFNHLHKFNDHVKSHLNIRDILCNICGKAFTTKTNLRRHKDIHDEKKRYKCNVCDKEFAQDAGLRAHRKLHQPYLIQKEKIRKKI